MTRALKVNMCARYNCHRRIPDNVFKEEELNRVRAGYENKLRVKMETKSRINCKKRVENQNTLFEYKGPTNFTLANLFNYFKINYLQDNR